MKRIYEVTATAIFINKEHGNTMQKKVSFPVSAESEVGAIAKVNTDERAKMVITTFIPQQHQHKVSCLLAELTATAK